jgi:hypothetical protein
LKKIRLDRIYVVDTGKGTWEHLGDEVIEKLVQVPLEDMGFGWAMGHTLNEYGCIDSDSE